MTIAPDRPATTHPAMARTVDDLPLPRPGYAQRGACRDLSDEIFLEIARQAEAKRICRTCPVRWDCLMDAVRTPKDKAVRAAMTETERRTWLREEGIGKAPDIDWAVVQGMADAGTTWVDIGAIYGLTGSAIHRRWTRHREQTGAKPPPTRRHGPKPPPVDVPRALALRAENKTWQQVADILGVSRNTVLRAVERARRAT